MKEMIKQISDFKGSKDFIKFGFSPAGKNHGWIEKVKKLSRSTNNLIARNAKRLVFLGYHFASNGGIDTEESKKIISSIE